MLHKQHQTSRQEKFALLHPADIASILESLPLDQRKVVWDAIKNLHDGQVLLEVSDAVRQTLILGRGVAIFAKAFMSILAQQAAKTTRPLMPAAAPAVLVTRSLPNKW